MLFLAPVIRKLCFVIILTPCVTPFYCCIIGPRGTKNCGACVTHTITWVTRVFKNRLFRTVVDERVLEFIFLLAPQLLPGLTVYTQDQ